MTSRILKRIAPTARLLLIAALLVPNVASAAEQDRVQFCWAMGKFDHTIYFAEVENREDRQASFDALLEISGIDHHAVACTASDVATATRCSAMAVVATQAAAMIQALRHNVFITVSQS